MPTFYIGYRNVLKGRNSNEMVNPYRNKVGTYTYNPLISTSHVLDGAPDNERTVGGDRPYSKPLGLAMQYAGRGFFLAPLDNPGMGISGPATSYAANVTLFQGLDSARALVDPGHTSRELYYSGYTNWVYDGLVALEPLADPGHAVRYTVYYGAFAPLVNSGVTVNPLNDPGHTIPTDTTNLYGLNKVNEWRGVPSTQAL